MNKHSDALDAELDGMTEQEKLIRAERARVALRQRHVPDDPKDFAALLATDTVVEYACYLTMRAVSSGVTDEVAEMAAQMAADMASHVMNLLMQSGAITVNEDVLDNLTDSLPGMHVIRMRGRKGGKGGGNTTPAA